MVGLEPTWTLHQSDMSRPQLPHLATPVFSTERGIWTLTSLRYGGLNSARLPIPPSRHFCTWGGIWTHTFFRIPESKSGASANSATQANIWSANRIWTDVFALPRRCNNRLYDHGLWGGGRIWTYDVITHRVLQTRPFDQTQAHRHMFCRSRGSRTPDPLHVKQMLLNHWAILLSKYLEHPPGNDPGTQLYKSRILPIKLWVLLSARRDLNPRFQHTTTVLQVISLGWYLPFFCSSGRTRTYDPLITYHYSFHCLISEFVVWTIPSSYYIGCTDYSLCTFPFGLRSGLPF